MWPIIRKLFREVHLWLGIASGIIIFLVCLSGTIYTFKDEIQEMIEPERYFVENAQDTPRLSLEDLIAKVEQEQGGKVNALTIPHDPSRVLMFNVIQPEEKGRGKNLPLNPYNGRITTTEEAKVGEFFMLMFRLHRWLLLDTEIGRPIVGWATIIFTLIVLSGMVIWIPQKVKNWKQGLKIKWSGNWKRINHDLHNTLGFYSSFLLLIMSLTGLFWSFDWYKTGLYQVFQVEQPARRGPQGAGGNGNDAKGKEAAVEKAEIPVLPLEKYLEVADLELPYPGNYRVNMPGPTDAEITLTKNKTGFFAPAGGDKLVLDKASGEVLQVEKFRDMPLNQRIMRSIKSLHIGDVFGTFSKILYFIACLVATTLPVTGTIIWINKLKKKSKRKRQSVLA